MYTKYKERNKILKIIVKYKEEMVWRLKYEHKFLIFFSIGFAIFSIFIRILDRITEEWIIDDDNNDGYDDGYDDGYNREKEGFTPTIRKFYRPYFRHWTNSFIYWKNHFSRLFHTKLVRFFG